MGETEVIKYLEKNPDKTRKEISKGLKQQPSVVGRAITKLFNRGELLRTEITIQEEFRTYQVFNYKINPDYWK